MTLVSSEITGQVFPVAISGSGLQLWTLCREYALGGFDLIKAVGSVLPRLHSLCRGAWGAQRPADAMAPTDDAQLSRCALASALSIWKNMPVFFKRLLNVYIP